jgi:hypothetical protein
MANNISATTPSTLDETIREAKEFGASLEEARKIHDLVKANAPSRFVRTFEVKFGPDSANNRAVWVHLIAEDELKPSPEKISELNMIANKVRFALLNEKLDVWPYVDFRGRS